MKKIYNFLWLSFAFLVFTINAQAQVISGLSNSSYTEAATPYIIDNDVVVTGGSSWGGGYVQYSIANANIGDQLNLTSEPNDIALGAVSVSGGVVYLGTGTSKDVIGSVDATLNGQNGNALRINFSSNFSNSSFENGLGGWTVGQQMVDIGVTAIAGFTTPADPTATIYNNNDGDSDVPSSSSFTYAISTANYTEGTKSLQLYSSMWTAEGCDIVHGPYVYSSPFQSSAGDVIYFDWRVFAGSDAYDVFGYILNTVTGQTTIVLNQTGQNYTASTNWATASVTVPANGTYRFVFISGTYDATCGQAAGASLYIDNVRVFGDKVNDAVVSKIAQLVTYNNACGTSAANRDLVLTVKNSAAAQATANAQIQLNTIAPTAICKNISAQLGANGTVTIAENATDNGSYDNCNLTFNTDVTTFGCSNVGVNNVVMTVYDTYGTSATCPATVTVVDQIAPTVITQNIILPLDASGNASITASSIDNGSFDACGIASMQISNSTFNCTNLGANSVQITITDVNGNLSSGNAVVTVVDALAPTALAQNATIYLNASGQASITANDINNGSYDNCGIVSVNLNKTNFECIDAGNNNVSLIVIDASGNISTAAAVVTVIDNISPTISGPANIVATATSAAGALVSFASPVGVDNCSYTITQTTGLVSGSVFPIGTTTNSYIITDASNNTNQFSFDVTVNGVAPQITCPANIVLNNGSGQCGAVANFNAIVTSGIPTPLVTYSHNSGSFFTVGTTTITVTATNLAGVATCTFDVVVNDIVPPSISCAFDITVNADPGQCGAIVNYSSPSATDNCGTGNLPTNIIGYTYKGTYGGHTYFLSNAMAYPEDAHASAVALGGHLATVTDVAENSFISSMSPYYMWIGYTDRAVEGQWKWISSEPVSYTNWAPGEPNNAGGNEDWAVINWGSSMWNDWYFTAQAYYVVEFDGGTLPTAMVSGFASGSLFPVGVTPVTYSATDASGNISTCTFNVTVIDNQAPTIVCPADINVYATSAAGAAVNFTAPTGADNCAIASVNQIGGLPSGSTFPIGTSTVTYKVTDTKGFADQCSFNITVTGIPPVINCPANITVGTDAGQCNAVVNFAATETTGIPASTISYSIAPGTVFGIGTTSVTAVATNPVGTSTCTFEISVADNELPTVITQNQTIYLDAAGTASVSLSTINNGSSDNCGIASMVLDKTDFTCAEVGNNTITLTVTDIHGNVNSATATVTVVDAIIPTVLTQNITIQLDANGQASITPNDINNGSFDNCGIANLAVSPSTFACGQVGLNTATLTATDVNGNISTNTSLVTVEDNIAPVVTGCPANITMNNLFNNCFQMVVYTPPTFSDACGIDTVFFSNNSGVVCYQAACCNNQVQGAFPVGVTTITYTAIDNNGNVTTCSFDITIVDTEPPTLNNCPQNITLNANPGTCARQFVFWTPPTPSDNCPSWSLTASHFPGQTFPVGTTTVTYLLIDNAGDVVNCSFDVTIVDNEAPVAICQNLTINLDAAGQASILASNIDNGSHDNCGIQSITLSQTNFDCSHVGANLVTMTVLDIHGNSSTCQATVTVVDNIVPLAVAKNITIPLDANGQVSISAQDVDNGSADNCTFTLAVTPTTFDCNNTGANTVTLTVTDASGNYSTTTAVVTVIDNLSPVVITQNATIYLDANGQASITTADVNNGSYDNCSFTLAVLPNSFNCSNTGANTVTLIATDASGNISSVNATVTVVDAIAPTVITQDVTIYLDANGQASINTSMINNGSYDNCSIATMVLDKTQFNCSDLGVNSVTLTLTDASNNMSSAQAVVTVIDNIAPIMASCPSDVTVNAIPASCSNTAFWTAPTATDNCTVSSLTSNFNSGDVFPLGATVVTYTATDNSGNTTTCSFTVHVIATPLTISQQTSTFNGNNISCNGAADGTIDITVNGGCLPYSYSWSNGTTTEDASGLIAGTYTVVATDANGAMITLSVTLTEPAALAANISSATIAGGWNISCNGATDGNADLTISGGTSPYTYIWSNGANSEDLSSIGAGTYTVTAIDLNGCAITETITLTEPAELIATITSAVYGGGFNTSCANSEDGNADLTVVGGTAPFTYIWNDGSGNEDLTQISAGIYYVSVTDQNNCSTMATIVLTEPTLLVAEAGSNASICNGTTIQLGGTPTAQGGIAPYQYAWSPSNTLSAANAANPTANPSSTTTYQLNVTDQNGCLAVNEVLITVNPLPVVSIALVVNDTYCREVNLVASSTSTVNSWVWSTGETTQYINLDPEFAQAGIYSVVATDYNGCQSAVTTYNYDPTSLITSYTIIGFKDMNLGERNYVQSGSVGLTGVGRTAKVMKYAEINGPNAFLKADNIQAMSGSIVPTKIYNPAVVTIPTMLYYTNSSISGTINVANNATVTITTNNKNIKIGRDATVTITGNNN